jgi:hypothetical protein
MEDAEDIVFSLCTEVFPRRHILTPFPCRKMPEDGEHDQDKERDLAPFRDEKGQDEPAYRGAIRKINDRYKRKERRAERDYVDWVLLAVSALLRDRIALSVGRMRSTSSSRWLKSFGP